MTYTIKQVAEKTGLSIYTLRFYDKAGLLPFVARNQAGYRTFTDGDLLLLHTICCLKGVGMKISGIRHYIELVMAGPDTVEDRLKLLTDLRTTVVEKQRQIAENLQHIDAKLHLYARPDAAKRVARKLAAASANKADNGLENPFAQHP
ncbi:MAG TPA: MerR family transcriptional regulator [Ruminococcaceae bacterium]|nr:MerR family transcriptional regulator [Oscillospiraceae bacterium]